MSLRIAYFKPASGGIADYAQQIETLYQRLGHDLTIQVVDPTTDPRTLVKKAARADVDLYHFEMGAADSIQLTISRLLRHQNDIPHLITLHDSGVGVRHPIDIAAAHSANPVVRFGGKVVRKLLDRTVGASTLKRHLADPRVATLYLRPDQVTRANTYYLPQPTYHERPPAVPKKSPPVVGFGGFWGYGKGIETLLQAWSLTAGTNELTLIVGGDAGTPDDPYAAAIRAQVKGLHLPIELPGFAAPSQLDAFIRSLGVMVLPYWAELPNGTSAMAMRAAELGVPIIASDVPSLRGFLTEYGAYYVPPKDPEPLAAAIRSFAADPEAFRVRAATLQQHIFAEHGWGTVSQRLEHIITKVVGK